MDRHQMDRHQPGIQWSPYMDVLNQTEALQDSGSMQSTIDTKKSIVRIIDPRDTYLVGDEVRINIQLYDSQGRPRTVGGDKLPVRIFEDSIGAGASGYILDHMNGTYTAVVKCLWVGQPQIHIYIDLYREDIRFLYDFFSKNHCTWTIRVTYKNNEQQPCHAYKEWLNTSEPICNMTHINGGMSWFCVAPKSNKTACSDVYKFESYKVIRPDVKRKTDHRPPRSSLATIRINVTGHNPSYSRISKTKPPCSTYNRTTLWFSPSPVGYFIHRKWEMTHCRAPPTDTFRECLRNRHLIFYGDSTVRQWHQELCKRYNCYKCLMPTKEWFQDKWKFDMHVYCDRINLSIDWVGSSFPGNIKRNFSNAAATHIFKYVNKKNMVFILHHFSHFVWIQPSMFRDRMRTLRQGIEKCLVQNQDAMFFIKGPNSHRQNDAFRYFSYVYRVILIEEFRGLHDKVFYLDNSDATVAMQQIDVHQEDFVVTGMVDQMMSYICK